MFIEVIVVNMQTDTFPFLEWLQYDYTNCYICVCRQQSQKAAHKITLSSLYFDILHL